MQSDTPAYGLCATCAAVHMFAVQPCENSSARTMTRMHSATPAHGLCATCGAARGVRMRF